MYIRSLYLGQSLSLEELQDLVQTRAEAEGWKKKRLELLGEFTVAIQASYMPARGQLGVKEALSINWHSPQPLTFPPQWRDVYIQSLCVIW